MRRLVATAVAACGLALAGSASGQVAATVYEGGFDGNARSKVKIKVLEDDGRLFVTKFVARRFAVECEGGVTAQVKKVYVRGRVPVRPSGSIRFRDEGESGTVLKVAGAVGPPPGGTFRFFGPMDAGASDLSCDSGRLFWVTD